MTTRELKLNSLLMVQSSDEQFLENVLSMF
jgi:hypothetical protein